MKIERIAVLQRRCPFAVKDYDRRDAWLLEVASREEGIQDRLRAVRSKMESEDKRHKAEMGVLRAAEAKIQEECDHEFARATAECEQQCGLCGYEEKPYRRS